MKKTYSGRRGTGSGTLDYRDLLQSVDSSSTIFDALSIKNLKQIKRDTISSYATWSSQRTARKKVVRRANKRDPNPLASVRETSALDVPVESCLTPDKSLRVNRALDPFDQIRGSPNESLHIRKEDLFDQLLHSTPEQLPEYLVNTERNTYPSSDTWQSTKLDLDIKENDMNNGNRRVNKSNSIQSMTLHLSSDLHKYKLNVEGLKNDEVLSDSIKSIVNNASFLKALVKRKSSDGKHSPKKNTGDNISTPTKRPEPLTSTPYLQKMERNYSMNVSPIQNKRKKLPKISITLASPCKSYSKKCLSDSNDVCNFFERFSIKVDKNNKNDFKSETNTSEKICLNSNENGTVNKSIISVHSDLDGEPFLGFTNFVEPLGNNTCDDSLKSIGQSDDTSPISDRSIITDRDKTTKNEIGSIKIFNSNSDPNLSFSSVAKKIAEDNVSESSESTYSYNTCSSIDESLESGGYKVASPRVCIERLNNSLLYKHCKHMNYDDPLTSSSFLDVTSQDEDINQSTENENPNLVDINDLKENSTEKCEESCHNGHIEGLNSMINYPTECYTQTNSNSNNSSAIKEPHSISNFNTDEVRESISISSDSDSSVGHSNATSNSSESSGRSNSSTHSSSNSNESLGHKKFMRSFVTTRRRNVRDDSLLMVLDDSVEERSVEFQSDVLDNMNVADPPAEKISGLKTNNKEKQCIEDLIDKKTELDSYKPIVGNDLRCYPNNVQLLLPNNLSKDSPPNNINMSTCPVRPSIVLQPGKKWERSLSLYKRQTMLQDHTVQEDTIREESPDDSPCRASLLHKPTQNKRGTLYFNDSVCGQRDILLRNPRRSTIRIFKEATTVRASFSASPLLEDDIGFLSEDCDETLAELSKLSISDSALDVTILEKRPEERHTSARDVVLRRCNQTDILPFHECYPDSVLKNCRKIGEGVYGEVFLYRGQDGRGRVMKVVPVEGALLVNGEHQKTFQEVISEVVIAMELSALRAPIEDIERHCDDERDNSGLDLSSVENATDTFNEVLAVRCVYGAYPARLLDLWELYDETKGSENDNPVVLPPDQLFMVLELANAGQDLESYQFNSAEQAYALFYQVAFALAVGEESYQLEHRDLHWGNVLIQPTDQKFARYVLRGRLHSVPRCGVSATIIDYTLSRVSLPLAGGERATLYNDLAADEGLFHAVGDYQFDIYRHMREKTGNDWKKFEPYTNILWLHYTVDKMITALRYKRTNTKIHKHYIAKLKGVRNRLLDYTSAAHFVLADNQI